VSRTKQAAYDEIHNAVYTGEKRNFTFENYIDKHAKAHQTPFEAGVEIREDKKVDDFLRGLTDPSIRMNYAKTLVYGNSDLRNDFRSCTEYLSSFVAAASGTQNRSISALEGGKPYGGRGRVRGNEGGRSPYGRGGRGYRGGRGGGRGKAGQNSIQLHGYTDTQWRELTESQKAEVNRLRALQKYGKRGVGAMESDREEHTVATAAHQLNTGDQFALANKKNKKNKKN
jgi:hypothetical protein